VLIGLGAGAFGIGAALAAGSTLLAYFATHPPRRPVQLTPAQFGAHFLDITFPSRDGIALQGWLVPARDPDSAPGGIILCHGMSANREEMLPWAEALWGDGFAVLMFDFRAGGESGGDLCTAGRDEAQDLLAAVDYLSGRPDAERLPLGVFGFSMGGAAAIVAAADDARILAIATHGAFASLDRAIKQRCRLHFGPFGPVAEQMTVWIGARTGWFPFPPDSISPVGAVARLAPRPILLLHGMSDRIIPVEDAQALHAAAGEPKQMHLMPGSGHFDIHPDQLADAQARLVGFFRHYLRPGAHARTAS
jgi:dipeptidyl aminopeptidase/acylaminoacyl peptidase